MAEDERFAELENKFNNLELDFDNLNEAFSELEKKVDLHDKALVEDQAFFNREIKQEISELKERVEGIYKSIHGISDGNSNYTGMITGEQQIAKEISDGDSDIKTTWEEQFEHDFGKTIHEDINDGENRSEGDRMVEQLPFGVSSKEGAHSPNVTKATTDSNPSECLYWEKGHLEMNCKECTTPNQNYCIHKFKEKEKPPEQGDEKE